MSRIETLLAAMTCEEKIGQLVMATAGYAVTGPVLASDATEGVRAGRIGGMLNLWGAEHAHAIQRMAVEESRLGIPLLLGFDIVHGHRTIFPIPLAEAALFDPVLWERTAREAAVEATRDGLAVTFAPMIDVARDPRWGRIAEGPGEDPWVAARFAEAKVRGFQGSNLAAADSLVATAKHFCAYGAATAGRDYASVDVSERSLHEIYLPPFQAAIAAGCAAIMPAFNDIAGIPMTAHVALLRDWLRGQAGFDGVVISDYNAIAELVPHGVAGDLVEAAALALKAGVDIDMMSNAYSRGLPMALDRGLISIHDIDEAAFRVLTLKQRLGLFDDPYRRGGAGTIDPSAERARRELARDVARRAIVILTNAGVLPLASGAQRIAVVGPLADARADMRGSWSAAGDANDPVTILEGLRAALPHCEIAYARGVDIESEDVSGIGEAIDACRSADVILMCLGEAASMSGEAASRADPVLPGRQRELAEAVLDLGRPVVALLSSGRPLMASWLVERADAVAATWFLGCEAGNAIADVVTGRFDPTGRLPVTWPRDIGQSPIFFAARPSGRPANPADHFTSKYLDMSVEPLFPFGHGLSYTRFALSNLRLSAETFRPGDDIVASVDVVNEGSRLGEETIFLFIRDVVASVARPLLELKGIAKIKLAPGERSAVHLSIPASAFSFLGLDFRPIIEPGRFELSVGTSADRTNLITVSVQATAG
ncbi:glycoside hydrolase family 3 N-terminal domain-containing protein [Methylocapsa sp. S129]|uniref:glycoside hydrolase family 3 N-terminal domain-containing protein n=1 Tax=Methylocapsa sp. S129 TaxID=1641869 RepID=UPI00131D6204|nr:glycoside hydrolase family 3 N-terminal domain-containing protein [Methylocapsa sp. S129]